LPNYDFQCAAHGVFEATSQAVARGVESVPCPRCGELAPVVWRRSPAMRKPGYEAIRFAGNDIPVESIEKALAQPEPDDELPMFSERGFEDNLMATIDEKTQKWFAGTLPPIELSENEIKTLKEGVAKG
jgi:hypothetical protein